MNALTCRALAALPSELQALIRSHAQRYADDINDLVSETAIALLESASRDYSRIFNVARSRTRRFTQDVAHYAACINECAEVAQEEPQQSAPRRSDYVRRVAEKRGVSVRRAQQLVRRALQNADNQQLELAF